MTAAWVRTHLGGRCRSKITPVLDALNQVPVDAWEIPPRHRQAVALLTPADIFPFASNTTRGLQVDHTVAWTKQRAAAGEKQSRVGTYGPMVGFHHRIKTHWMLDAPTTLSRGLCVARPLRCDLPRRPHRKTQGGQLRADVCAEVWVAAGGAPRGPCARQLND